MRRAFSLVDYLSIGGAFWGVEFHRKATLFRMISEFPLFESPSADDLAVLIQDSRYYKCWAGCTKEMIRTALGHPIRVLTKEIGEPIR